MKRIFLSFLNLCFAYNLHAQITLTNSKVPLTFGTTHTSWLDLNYSIQIPTKGTNQTWDYSQVALSKLETNIYTASTNPMFPGAVNVNTVSEIIPRRLYYYNALFESNSANFGVVAYEIPAQRYSLGTITGYNGDSIIFPNQNYNLPTKEIFLQFPTTINSSWQTNYRHIINTNIKLFSSGLNKAPFQRRSNVTVTDSIIGWGTMRVFSGVTYQASIPYQVLQLKRMEVAIDSFYLNGAPAPLTLLNKLGVSQGQIRRNNKYKFYRENAMKPLMEFDFGYNDFHSPVSIKSDASGLTISGLAPNMDNRLQVQLYPNPTYSSKINIAFERPESGYWKLKLVDNTGRELQTYNVTVSDDNKQILTLPESVKNGIYNWQLFDNYGQMRRIGKLSVIH